MKLPLILFFLSGLFFSTNVLAEHQTRMLEVNNQNLVVTE